MRFHFYFLYPCSAHLHEKGASWLIMFDLEYFVASRQLPSFSFLLKMIDVPGIILTAPRLNTMLSVLFATEAFYTIKENNKETSICRGKLPFRRR